MFSRTRTADAFVKRDRPRSLMSPFARTAAVVGVVAGLLASSLVAATSQVADPIGSWTLTDEPMGVGRVNHVATILDGTPCESGSPPDWCGQVLVVGSGRAEGKASAELYNPRTGDWTATNENMKSSHQGGHTATLLKDGRVLVVGGAGAPNGSPEIYDPDAGTWKLTKPIDPLALEGEEGTALDGPSDCPSISGCEVQSHVAVRLDGPACRGDSSAPYCGRVLVTAATSYFGVNSHLTLLYDPVQDKWETTTPTLERRRLSEATLLDGPPCHAASPPAYCGMVLVAGGGNTIGGNTEAARTAELYDPATATWTPTAPLAAITDYTCNSAAACHAAISLPDGEVLLVGGLKDSEHNPTDSGRRTQRYDPLTRQWRLVAETHHDRRRTQLAMLSDGRVLAAGGALGPGGDQLGQVLASAEIYDWSKNTWARAGDLRVPRGFHTATPLQDGRVLVAGGRDPAGNGFGIPLAETFDVSSSTVLPAVLTVEPSVGSVAGGTQVTIGGSGFSVVTSVKFGTVEALRYVVQDDRTIVAVAPVHPAGSVEVVVTTSAGPSAGGAQATFTFVSDAVTWRPTDQPMTNSKRGHTATLIGARGCEGEVSAAACGKVLVVGGVNGSALEPELYDPVTGWWKEIKAPGGRRHEHSANALSSGRVLLSGGRPTDDGRYQHLATSELYDPGTSSWHPTGNMSVARSEHTGTVLDSPACAASGAPAWCGKVLVVGGWAEQPGSTNVFFDRPECKVPQPPPYCAPVSAGRVHAPTASAELYDPATGLWQTVLSMQASRSGHSTTLLSDGRVLVAGGWGLPAGGAAEETLAGAEIYDPGTNTWTATGSMEFRREVHTATLLEGSRCALPGAAGRCGQVLVMGGGAGRIAAELYDPATGDWSRTGVPYTSRSSQTATLLTGGSVLAVGPDTGAELYDETGPPPIPVVARIDPAVGQSGPLSATTKITLFGTAFPSLPVVRFGEAPGVVEFSSGTRIEVRPPPDHPQGTVAVTVGDSTMSSAPVRFTFGSGRWGESGSLLDYGDGWGGGRYLHTASLLQDGKVLVAGGTTTFLGCQPCDPRRSSTLLSAAEVYDPATGRWSGTGPLGVARHSHTATVLADGRVLVTGGQSVKQDQVRATGEATVAAEIYDPGNGKWSPTLPMTFPRFSHSATLLVDGRVLVAGGAVDEEERARAVAAAEIFDPATNSWTIAESLDDARASHSATLLDDGSVLVAGGLAPDSRDGPTDGDGVALASAELYDPVARRWDQVAPLAIPRFSHTATSLEGPACSRRGAAGSCGMVLVAGGTGGGPNGFSSAELYDPATRSWSPTGSLRRPRGGHEATLLDDGRVLVMGSGPSFPFAPVPPPTPSAEVYDPGTGQWSFTLAAGTARAGHTLTLLSDGRALVAGGFSTMSCCWSHTFTVASELYVPAPTVLSALPAAGPTRGGTEIAVTGLGFDRTTEVRLGGAPAAFTSRSPRELIATAPAHERGPARLEAIGPGGTSNRLDRVGQVDFTYRGQPGEIAGLVAEALSSSTIMVSFAAADDGSGGAGLVTSYIVKQSDREIRTPEDFAAATSLCENGICIVEPGLAVKIRVDDLEPNRTYHYAVQAVNDDKELGPRSASVAATTLPGGAGTCPPVRAPGADELRYDGGVYSLVGLPGGTTIDANSPLYGWLDLGARGGYSVMGSNQPVEAGRGYWAWFACPRLVSLNGPGEPAVSLPLGAYHASMVGNPSGTSPASVTGHDFAARWDPSLNDGGGGYRISGYREAQTLAVGEGAWAFTFDATTVSITASAG